MTAVRRMMPLNALRAFEASARLLSFTRAAEELAVTPGAISQQIRLLEDSSGSALFKRQGRGLELTDTARAALPALSEAFEKLQDASALLREPSKRRQVTVSVAPSFAAKWLMPRLDAFHDAHPDIEIWISADMELADLASGPVDLAVRYGAGGYPGLISERLVEEQVLPLCSPTLLKGDKAIRGPADLAHHVLLHDGSPDADPSCPDWAMWLKARGVTGVDGRRGPRFNQSSMVIEAAAMGRGVALAKRTLAQSDLESGRLVAPFADGGTPIDFAYHIVLPRNRPQSASTRAFADWLKFETAAQDQRLDQL